MNVPVSLGRVILPGETIATLAEDQYILRLQLPERHAQFMRAGDTVLIGARGMQAEATETMREGKGAPRLSRNSGRTGHRRRRGAGLGDYFVGERTRVYIDAGTRRALVVPASYVYRRAGVELRPPRRRRRDRRAARRARDIGEVKGVEILAGLKDGDTLAAP